MGALVGALVDPLVGPLVGRGSLSPVLCVVHFFQMWIGSFSSAFLGLNAYLGGGGLLLSIFAELAGQTLDLGGHFGPEKKYLAPPPSSP